MAAPLGKREIVAWTICGVLAVVAAISYSQRSASSAPAQLRVESPLTTPVIFDSSREKTIFVKGDTTPKMTQVRPPTSAPTPPASLPQPEISTPLTKREPYDTAWVRVGTRRYQATITVNGESRGEIGVARWFHARAGEIRISINAPNCVAWDTTVTVPAGERRTIGNRMPRC